MKVKYLGAVMMKERIKALGSKAIKIKPQLATEEAAKHALVIPFLLELGYDVYNPSEVVPEYIADFGTKKGEKVDYAIMKDGKPAILIECKHCMEELPKHSGQLFRYYSTIPGKKLAILTNGIKYMLFSDLDESNKLDQMPFFEFDITAIKDGDIDEINKLHKTTLDMDNILNYANELKYTEELKKAIHSEFMEASEEFVCFFAKLVYSGPLTQSRKVFFTPLVKKSVTQVIDNIFRTKLDKALEKPVEEIKPEPVQQAISKVITTDEEMDAYHIIRAVACRVLPAERIRHKDYHSFFGINIDGKSVAKQFCKLMLTDKKKSMVLVKVDKTETTFELQQLTDIYNYSEEIINTVQGYEKVN